MNLLGAAKACRFTNSRMTSGPDLILGVSRAADAVKQREALARLERLSRQSSVDVAANAGAASSASAPASVADWQTQLRIAGANAPRSGAVMTPPSTADAAEKKTSDVYVQFEAVLLQNMVEAMMPKESESMFGGGTAGGMWKSMLAEKVAAEIARSGVIGVAKQVAAGEAALHAAAANNKTKVGDV